MKMNLTRRGFMIGGAATLSCFKAMPSTPSCTLAAEQEVGPYYIAYDQLKRDITEDKPGVPLELRVALVDSKRCTPLPNAALDIWHCDASGVYSGFSGGFPGGPGGPRGRGPGGPGGRGGPGGPDGLRGRGPGGFGFGPDGPPPARQTNENRFLRGVQLTDEEGFAEFATLYPGWYVGRTIHIHLKVRLGGAAAGEKYAGGHVSHTGQLFFPEEFTEQIAKIEPYSKRLEIHRTLNQEDGIFRGQHGGDSVVTLQRSGKSNTEGLVATVMLAVDPEATPASVGRGRGF